MDLFVAPVLRSECNPKAHIRRHLAQEARGCTYLVLWLDCDREGENICYEGMLSCFRTSMGMCTRNLGWCTKSFMCPFLG
jgi:DNA topoisomerase IA